VQPFKVLVKSPFSIYSGYGQDGFGLLRALRAWGCDVYPQPQWLDCPVPQDLLPLFSKTLRGPFDLTINHWDPTNLYIRPEARELTRAAVAWTMWEFSPPPTPTVQMPDGKGGFKEVKSKSGLVPHCKGRGTLAKRLELFDLVLGYDHVTMASLDSYIPGHVARGVLQGGYESSDYKPVSRDWHTKTDFMFAMHGALNNRKQVWGTVQAWVELCHEHPEFVKGAKLGLHTTVPGVFPEMNEIYQNMRLKVFMEAWDKPTLDDFYAASHVLLAPSRGEGKNLPALEFMTTGGVVAASNYGGHTMWLNGEYAYPLDYQLTPTFPGRPDAAHDAKVEVSTIKDSIWHIYNNRAEAAQKGALAAEIIPRMCDWSVVVEQLFNRVRDLCPHNGELIWSMAQKARIEARERTSERDFRREREGRWEQPELQRPRPVF